jgi:hypothetical protein
MPSFYCIKFGLVIAVLILVGIVALFTLIHALSSFEVKHKKGELGYQNV